MKKLLPLVLALAGSVPALAGTLQPGGMLTGQNFWPGLKVGIGWSAKGLGPSTKIKVTLLRNGAPLRVLGSGLALTNDNPGQSPQQAWQLGGIWWTPTVRDIGCNYAALVATEDGPASFTSQPFGLLDFAACPASGAYTWLVGKVTNVTDVSRIPDGKNLIPGNEYWIRASGDGSSYFGPQFVISGASHVPAPGATPVHKLPSGGGSAPGKPLP